jgi:hypothetical protein
MNEHQTTRHLGGPVETPCQSYLGGLLGRGCYWAVRCVFLHSGPREKGDETQRIEMLAVSPSLISSCVNFLCKNLELQEC